MASSHFSSILNDSIELIVYSEGGISLADIENMSADELTYLIYNFKKYYTEKNAQKQEFVKGVMEFAKHHIEQLFKLLAGRR